MKSHTDSVDHRLVMAIAGGSAEALERLYDRHGRWIFSLARSIVAIDEDSEEVVQDVYSQVWRDAGRYDEGRANVVTWLGVLTRSRALDRLRARRSRPDWYPHAVLDGNVAGAVPEDPEQTTIAADQAVKVRAVLETLPDAQRAALNLAYYEGLSHAEIARHTGTPLGTVKTRLRSALGTLRSTFQHA